MTCTLALAQIDPALGDIDGNMRKHVEMAERAHSAGADLVVFPELSLTGYSVKDMNWDLSLNIERDPSRLSTLLHASRSIPIIAGGIEEDSSFRLYNSAFFFNNGTVTSIHRKVYLPTYGMFEEMRYFSRGETVRAADFRGGKIGVLVCEDLWHISLPYLLALDGASVIIALVASPTRLTGDDAVPPIATVNRENHKAYARLLTTYVAFCNRVGFEDGINFWGGSSILGPDGDVIAEAKLFEEDLIIARIDDNEVRRARRFSRHFLDEDAETTIRELERIRQKRIQ